MTFCELFSHIVQKKQPTKSKQTWELLQHCLQSIPGEYCMNLVEWMPRIIWAVIKAKTK